MTAASGTAYPDCEKIFDVRNSPSRLPNPTSRHRTGLPRSTIPRDTTSGNKVSIQLLTARSSPVNTFRRIECNSWSWVRRRSSSNHPIQVSSSNARSRVASSGGMERRRWRVSGELIESRWIFPCLNGMVRRVDMIHRGSNLHTNSTFVSFVAFERSIESGDGPMSSGKPSMSTGVRNGRTVD